MEGDVRLLWPKALTLEAAVDGLLGSFTMAEGFDPERFVQKDLAERFVCSICLCVVRDPTQCKREHFFCKQCVTPALRAQADMYHATTCPECRCPMDPEQLPEPSRLIKYVHSSLKIRCKYFDRGCEEEVPASDASKARAYMQV